MMPPALLPMLRTTLILTILTVFGLTALSEIGVNIAPLLAGAGIRRAAPNLDLAICVRQPNCASAQSPHTRHCHGAPGLRRSRWPGSPTRMNRISYSGFQQAIWLYLRFTLSLRDVEDLLAERGVAKIPPSPPVRRSRYPIP